MQAIDIDYAHSNKPWSLTLSVIALICALLGGLLLWQNHTQLTQNITDLQSEMGQKSTPQVNVMQPDIDTTITLAHQVEAKLNADWLPLLTTLETAQKTNTAIKLTHIKPNLNRQQLTLIGEAKQFITISNYMKLLEKNSALHDVALKSQYNSVEHQGYIKFQLTMEWAP